MKSPKGEKKTLHMVMGKKSSIAQDITEELTHIEFEEVGHPRIHNKT